jgi:hypothetical protein
MFFGGFVIFGPDTDEEGDSKKQEARGRNLGGS